MRFEVEIDDGDNLITLNAARAQYNADNAQTVGFAPVDDMPSFVQRMAENAATAMLQKYPAPLPAAVQAEIDRLKVQLAEVQAAAQLQSTPAIEAATLN